MRKEATLYEQFACLRAARRQARRKAEADRLDLPTETSVQAGATIKKNLEILGYVE